MFIDQIVYGSANRAHMKGYQVLGQSEGVDNEVTKRFCRYAPSHGTLGKSPDAWGLSFFPVDDSRFAIARSMHGGPEYSGRGGLTVVTRALIVTSSQLSLYSNDPISFARTAMALGHLILPDAMPQNLPVIEIPDRPLPMEQPQSDFADLSEPALPAHAVKWVAREAFSMLNDGSQVMICGVCDPLPILYLMYELISAGNRPLISFASGIQRSSRRSYRVQFTDEPLDPSLSRQLSKQAIAPIDLERVLVS